MPGRCDGSESNRLLVAADALLDSSGGETLLELLGAPLIVLAAPRSGSTLLYEQLSRLPGFWSIGGESHGIFRAFPHLVARDRQFDSGSLDSALADASTCKRLRACFAVLLRDHRGRPWLDRPAGTRPTRVTLVEKTPRNVLSVPFLLTVFPAARFVFLHREPRTSIASIVEAWETGLATGRFVTYRGLPGWNRAAWCFLLPPGWQSMTGRPLVEIASFQWSASNGIALDALEALENKRWMHVGYRELVADPAAVLATIRQFAGLPETDAAIGQPLPLSRTTLSPPDPDKWKRYEREILGLRSVWEPVAKRIAALG